MNDIIDSTAPRPTSDVLELPTVQGRYDLLVSYREPYLQRGFDCAELTLPALLPRYGHTSTNILPTPYQSVGARGVNHLSSKLLMALFPPNTPIFKIQMTPGTLQELTQKTQDVQAAKALRTTYDKYFGVIERTVMADCEIQGDRTALFEALKHLLVVGNSLLHMSSQGVRVFPLNQFVVRRDPAGNPLEMILKEDIDPVALPKHVQAAIKAENRGNKSRYGDKKSVALYTYVARTETEWVTYQEVCGKIIERSRGTFPLDRCPWIALRFNRINGEDYGRGYVEEYIGDFTSLENLTAAIVQGAAAASKVLFLVKPNSSTKVKVLAKTSNGGFASGNAEDVTVLQLNKQGDFSTAKALREDLIQQLSYAFLLNTAVQREAERVTAEEIRYMAQELEQTLGGFYSIMSIELQLPYIQVKMDALERKGKLPKLPKDTARPVIVTGLTALGRGNDRNKLVQFLQTLAAALGQDAVKVYVNVSEAIERLAIADGIDTENLIRTEEDVAASQQQQQQDAQRATMMQEGMKSLGPAAISAFGGAAKQRIANQGAIEQEQEKGKGPQSTGGQ